MTHSTNEIRKWSNDKEVTSPKVALEMCDEIDYLRKELERIKEMTCLE